MPTSYTTRTRPSTTYTGRTRPTTDYTGRTRQTKWKDYLRGLDDLGNIVFITDQDGNKIVIYADSGFEQVDYNTRGFRTRI